MRLCRVLIIAGMVVAPRLFAGGLPAPFPVQGATASLPEPFAGPEIPSTASCDELDQAIARLQPLTLGVPSSLYSRADEVAAFWAGVLIHPVAFGYIGYSTYRAAFDELRREEATQRIESLRRRKALRHCYEEL